MRGRPGYMGKMWTLVKMRRQAKVPAPTLCGLAALAFDRREHILVAQRLKSGMKLLPAEAVYRAVVRDSHSVLRGKTHDVAGDRFKLGILSAVQHDILGHARHPHGAQFALEHRTRHPAGKESQQMQQGERRDAGDAVLAIARGAHDTHPLSHSVCDNNR